MRKGRTKMRGIKIMSLTWAHLPRALPQSYEREVAFQLSTRVVGRGITGQENQGRAERNLGLGKLGF